MKERIKTVSNWKELVEFVEETNPYRNTLVLAGFINNIQRDGTVKIKKLVFKTSDIKVLIKNGNMET